MLSKVVFYAIEYLIATPKLITNWVKIRILKKDLKFELLQKIKRDGSDKFALIASYPGTGTFLSLQRQIQFLESYGYSVIVVLNGNSKSRIWAEELSNLNCSVLHRENLGADFGAFKVAVSYLQKEWEKSISQVLLTNDSLYFTPNSINGLDSILKNESELNCLFFHKQSIRHAGSMFIKFDFSKITQDDFWDFWGTYYPFELKKQIVRKGEHKLTQTFGMNYFKPLVNAESVKDLFVDLEVSELMQAEIWSKRSHPYIYQQINLARKFLDHRRILELCISNLQVSNSMGLWASRVFEIPFKLDLPQSGLSTISDLIGLAKLQGCGDEELRELRFILEKRENITESSDIRKFLWRRAK